MARGIQVKAHAAPEFPLLQRDQIVDLPLDIVHPDPDQPRRVFNEETLQLLADDIRARGVQQPIGVRPHPDRTGEYMIVFGERRYRASRLAGKDAIRAMLNAGDQVIVADDALCRYIDQFRENHNREDLKPMELAQFLVALRDRHAVKVSDIPTVLGESGIAMSRSYVSNMIRLVELPGWAQDLISDGRLTPSHGKYLLWAKDSPAVMDAMEAGIKDWLIAIEEGHGEPLTTDNLVSVLDDHYREHHRAVSLQTPHSGLQAMHDVQFDIAACAECKTSRRIQWGRASPRRYCLNPDCYDQKQDAAQQAIRDAAKAAKANTPGDAPPQAMPVTVNDDGIVSLQAKENRHLERWGNEQNYVNLRKHGVAFDIRTCNGCKHKKPASHDGTKQRAEPHCFNLDCFKGKQKAAALEASLEEKVHDYLDAWLRRYLLDSRDIDVGAKPNLISTLLSWYGAGARTYVNHEYWKGYESDADIKPIKDDELPVKGNLSNWLATETPVAELQTTVARHLILSMRRDNLRRLARSRYLVVPVAREWRLDAAYVGLFQKTHLIDLARELGLDAVLPEKPDAIKTADLRARLVSDWQPGHPVPARLQQAWAYDPDA